jgi:perosamine synthetase
MKIGYTRPSITELEIRYATEAVTSGWGSACYEWLDRFENEFARYVGSRHAIATSSCTGAMQLGLHALGIGTGDEVILADTNWVATLAPVVHRGATPVLVDIDPVSWCIDPNLVRKAITPRTKAVIATHLYGNLCDMTELVKICDEFNLFLIEDSAEAIGSFFGRSHAGSMGTIGVFSFHGTKTMTTGEGGALVTNDSSIASRVKALNLHGRSEDCDKQFWADEVGYKFRMSNVQAAIGVAQLERIDDLVTRKREILEYYRSALGRFPELTLNPIDGENVSGAWMPNVVFAPETGITREVLLAEFRRQGIDARVFFWPLSDMPLPATQSDTPLARSIAGRSINLPSYHDMGENEQNEVVAVLSSFLQE